MTGEILRNILTSGTRMRRQRFYQTPPLVFLGPTVVGQTQTAMINFDPGREFLCTGMAMTIYGNAAGTNELTLCGLRVQLRRPNSGYTYFSNFAEPFSMFPSSFNINMDNITGEYLWFRDNDNFDLAVQVGTSKAGDRTVTLQLAGIEYLP